MDKMKPRRARLQYVSEIREAIRQTPTHRFETWVIIWYTAGQGTITFVDHVQELRRGLVYCIPPRTPYRESAAGGFMSLWIIAESLPLPGHAPSRFDLAEDQRFAHAARLLLEEYRRQAEGWSESCELWLSGVLRCFTQNRRPLSAERSAGAMAEVMRQHALDPEFTAARAMARVGGSQVYLRRIFRTSLGITPTRYLLELRIEHAKQLLRLSDLSIAEVALRSGYLDQFYFSRLFRARSGLSPLQYRQRLGEG